MSSKLAEKKKGSSLFMAGTHHRRALLNIPKWVWPLMLVLTILSVWVRLGVVKATYDVSQADRTIRNLQQEKEQIELRVAGLKSPRRLESLARARFELSQPRTDQVIYLGVGGKSK